VFFVPTLVLFIVFFSIAFFSGIFGVAAEPSNALDIISDLLGAVISPYFYVLGYLQYHDLKLRKNM
jgi:hypothetical protein